MRRYAFILFALPGVIACSSNDSAGPTVVDASADAPSSGSRNDGSIQGEGGGADGGSPDGGSPDAGSSDAGNADAGSADAGNADAGSADGGPPDAGDAGEITSSLGSTGDIAIYNDFVTATFYEDDTILRSGDAPDCVVYARSATKPSSIAGTLIIGGAIVGSEGGTPSIIEIGPPDAGAGVYGVAYQYLGPVFPATDDLLLQVEATGTDTFPEMGVQLLRLPPANPLVVTQPALGDSGNLTIPSTQAFTIEWTVPSGAVPDAEPGLQVGFRFLDIGLGGNGSKHASLYCSFPFSAGTGQVPADLLSAIENEVGANVSGQVQIFVGSQIEFTSMGASYDVAVLTDPSSSDAPSFFGQGDFQ